MEQLVRNAICEYNNYQAEVEFYAKLLEEKDDPEMRESMALLKQKIGIVDAWILLLSTDEKFVVRKHLIEEIDWPRVAFEYRERWKDEFIRTERSLQIYQARAIAKIADFAEKHSEIVLKVFVDVTIKE